MKVLAKFKIPLDDFPVLVAFKKQAAVGYHLGKYLNKKPSEKEYMGLDKVEDLLKGETEYLVFLILKLFNADRRHEAKGVYTRHNITQAHFAEFLPKKAGIAKDLEAMKYDPSKDYQVELDLFEPVSKPSESYLRLPTDIEVKFISREEDVAQLKKLEGLPYVGVDSEWRP